MGARATGEGPFFWPLQLCYCDYSCFIPPREPTAESRGIWLAVCCCPIPVSIPLDGAPPPTPFLDNAELNSLICNRRVLCWLTGSSETHRKPLKQWNLPSQKQHFQFLLLLLFWFLRRKCIIMCTLEKKLSLCLSVCSVETWLQCPGMDLETDMTEINL